MMMAMDYPFNAPSLSLLQNNNRNHCFFPSHVLDEAINIFI
jgi:hypothetical protein